MIKKLDKYTCTVDTAGLGGTGRFQEKMHFSPISSCANIENGVSFNIGRGDWLISYEDFLEMVKIVKHTHEETSDDSLFFNHIREAYKVLKGK